MRCQKKYIAYGGARGGGKSWALRKKLVLLGLKYPGIVILLLRRSYPELRENHIVPMMEDLNGIATYRSTDKTIVFPNGSRILFGYCENEVDALRYQGNEYDVIAIDEATQFSEAVFTMLKASVRGVNGYPKRMYLTCNPGGVGHEWVKRLFVDRDFKETENPDDYELIRATVFDNPVLMEMQPDYIENLNSLPDDLRRAWRDGDWDVFAGQFFPEFNRDIHVCEPFEIPDHWNRYRAFDYGLDRLACLWFAISPDGKAYLYRELNESELIVSEAAKKIKFLSEGEKYLSTFIPPDLWSRTKDSGKSIADLFIDNGIYGILKAPNSRVDGWSNVKEWLKPKDDFDGAKKTSSLQIFSNCIEIIKNIPKIQHDAKNPCDCATEPHNITHNLDALRYFCASYTAASKEPPTETDFLARHKERMLSGGDMGRRNRYW
jgi:phage terminase large subunit